MKNNDDNNSNKKQHPTLHSLMSRDEQKEENETSWKKRGTVFQIRLNSGSWLYSPRKRDWFFWISPRILEIIIIPDRLPLHPHHHKWMRVMRVLLTFVKKQKWGGEKINDDTLIPGRRESTWVIWAQSNLSCEWRGRDSGGKTVWDALIGLLFSHSSDATWKNRLSVQEAGF